MYLVGTKHPLTEAQSVWYFSSSFDIVQSDGHHCVKYLNFTEYPGVKVLWKDTVSAEFLANCSKLCGNCTLPQNFHTRKLDEITIFYQVDGAAHASQLETT